MSFKSNPYLEEAEKKHPKAFFLLSLIASIILVIIGVALLCCNTGDVSVPIIMIIFGIIGVPCSIYLKVCK